MIQITINSSPLFATEDDEMQRLVDFDLIKCVIEREIHYEYPEETIEFNWDGEPSRLVYFFGIICTYAESDRMMEYVNDYIDSINSFDDRYLRYFFNL